MEFRSGAVSPTGSIEDGWKIIKDDYWTFFAMILVAGIIIIVASLILGSINGAVTKALAAMMGLATANSGDAMKISASLIPQVISAVIGIFVNFVVTVLSGALFCGIYSALSRKANTGITDFSDLFSGFQKINPCLIVAAVMSLVQFVVEIVTLIGGAAVGISSLTAAIITSDGRINPAVFGGLFLFLLAFLAISILINVIIWVLTVFVYPLIAERNLSGGEALLLSVKSGISNIGGLVLLYILMFLMSLGGALLCLVGILFVLPIITASTFAAFQSVFGRMGTGSFQTPPPPPNFGM